MFSERGRQKIEQILSPICIGCEPVSTAYTADITSRLDNLDRDNVEEMNDSAAKRPRKTFSVPTKIQVPECLHQYANIIAQEVRHRRCAIADFGFRTLAFPVGDSLQILRLVQGLGLLKPGFPSGCRQLTLVILYTGAIYAETLIQKIDT